MSKNFDVPFVANIPVEVEGQLNERTRQDISYLDLKNKKTLKKYMDETSKLRIVAKYLSDYFRDNFMETLSYKQVADALGYSEEQVQVIVSELAGWDKYPLVIIKTPKKKGHFQLHSKNLEDTEKWMTSRKRFIASAEQRLDKTEIAVSLTRIKQKSRKKVKVINGTKNK